MKKFTKGNLEKLWKLIDDADSNLRLALELAQDIKKLENSDILTNLEDLDLSKLSSINQEVEALKEYFDLSNEEKVIVDQIQYFENMHVNGGSIHD